MTVGQMKKKNNQRKILERVNRERTAHSGSVSLRSGRKLDAQQRASEGGGEAAVMVVLENLRKINICKILQNRMFIIRDFN